MNGREAMRRMTVPAQSSAERHRCGARSSLIGCGDSATSRPKTHLGVYPFSADAVAAVRSRLDGFDVSTGTIRFTREHPIPEDVVRDLVLFRREQIRR